MGATQLLPNGSPVGVISTLRFWSIPKGEKTHELTAAMTYPHNSDNMVSATALSWIVAWPQCKAVPTKPGDQGQKSAAFWRRHLLSRKIL
jgi:hypothetical protein